jgi:hypothetical protein
VEKLCEAARRKKGREEGDVCTIRRGMDDVDCIAEPVVLVESHCIVP